MGRSGRDGGKSPLPDPPPTAWREGDRRARCKALSPLAGGGSGGGRPPAMKARAHHIESADGVRLFVREGGTPQGPPMLLLHGWSQHHLSWAKQFEGALAERFRLIAPDLRGHGASDKPGELSHYDRSRPWAEDVAAIMEVLGLDRPLLVGWSMGGRIALDYLHHFGSDGISGLALIGSSVVPPGDPDLIARRRPDAVAEGMYSDDQRVNLAATIAFVKACFAAPLSKMDLATIVGFNMLVPPAIRRAARLRAPDYEPDFRRIACPVTLYWGEAERLVFRDMIDATRAAIPQARLESFPGAGHAPFWERAADFDTRLAAFAFETMGEIA